MGLLRAAPFAAFLIASLFGATSGHAVEAVNVRSDVTAIDLTGVVELVKTETDTIQVSAAPGADGIVRRMQQPEREYRPIGWSAPACSCPISVCHAS